MEHIVSQAAAKALDTTVEEIRDVLRGFGRRNQAALNALIEIADWPQAASAELRRRSTRIVEVLDNAALRAIEAGEIDFREVCRDAHADAARVRS